MQDEDDDVDGTPPMNINKKEKGISHRLPDLPEGTEDCYWCGRVLPIINMQRQRNHNSVIYICRDCGPT
jgi:hypothetical protein